MVEVEDEGMAEVYGGVIFSTGLEVGEDELLESVHLSRLLTQFVSY